VRPNQAVRGVEKDPRSSSNWKLETRNWKLENANWGSRLPVSNSQFLLYGMDSETGNWEMGNGNWGSQFPVSNFQFPFPVLGFSVQAARLGLTLV
jgi:hypothetical protein